MAKAQYSAGARVDGFKIEIVEVKAAEKHKVLLVPTGVQEKAKDMAATVARVFCDHPQNMGPGASHVHYVPGFWNFIFKVKATTEIHIKK